MLDKLINSIEVRFKQKTINIIKCIVHLIKEEIDNDDVINLSKIFELNLNELEAKIYLLKANYKISKEKINTFEDWIK